MVNKEDHDSLIEPSLPIAQFELSVFDGPIREDDESGEYSRH